MGVHMHMYTSLTHHTHTHTQTPHTSLIADLEVSFSRLYYTLPSSRLLPQSDFTQGYGLASSCSADLGALIKTSHSDVF